MILTSRYTPGSGLVEARACSVHDALADSLQLGQGLGNRATESGELAKSGDSSSSSAGIGSASRATWSFSLQLDVGMRLLPNSTSRLVRVIALTM